MLGILSVRTTYARKSYTGNGSAKHAQERNIILSQAFEYREPSLNAIKDAANASATPGPKDKIKLDMTSRFLGLIVVPGQYITKIEVEDSL